MDWDTHYQHNEENGGGWDGLFSLGDLIMAANDDDDDDDESQAAFLGTKKDTISNSDERICLDRKILNTY